MDNRTRYIPSIVMLMAGFVACIITIVHDYSTKDILLISTGVMVVFLVVGFIIKLLVERFIFTNTIDEIEDNNEENNEEISDEISEASNEKEKNTK